MSGAHFLLRGLTMGSVLSSCLVSSPSYYLGQYFGSLFNLKNDPPKESHILYATSVH